MTITISIVGGQEYAHKNGLVEYFGLDCTCLYDTGKPQSNCLVCKGTGQEQRPCFPFELNMSNQNFSEVWGKLGLDSHEFCGTMDGRELRAVLAGVKPSTLTRSLTVDGNYIDCGITLEQAVRYLNQLWFIACEAEEREEMVVWC